MLFIGKFKPTDDQDSSTNSATATISGSERVRSLPQLSLKEKVFVGKLITGCLAHKDLTKFTPKHVLTTDHFTKSDSYDISSLIATLSERRSELPLTSKSGVSVIVSDPESQRYAIVEGT